MANEIDLCISTDVAADLNITSDATVSRVVTAASQMIASYLGYPVHQSEQTEYPLGTGRAFLILSRSPIQSVASVTVNGKALGSSDYRILSKEGMLQSMAGKWPLVTSIEGFTTWIEGQPLPDPDALTVTYTAGYVTPGQNAVDPQTYPTVTLPPDIIEAAIALSCGLYRSRGLDPNVSGEHLGQWSVSYRDRSGVIPPEVRAMLAPYRRIRP